MIASTEYVEVYALFALIVIAFIINPIAYHFYRKKRKGLLFQGKEAFKSIIYFAIIPAFLVLLVMLILQGDFNWLTIMLLVISLIFSGLFGCLLYYTRKTFKGPHEF